MTEKAKSPRRKISVLALLGAALILVSLIGIHGTPDLLQFAFLPAEGNGTAPQAAAPETTESVMGSDDEEPTPAPHSTSNGESAVFSAARDALSRFSALTESAAWAGEQPTMTLQGQKANATVSRKEGVTAGDVRLILAGPRYFEVFPQQMLEGNRLSDAEVSHERLSTVLDSRLAFSLFGEISPLGKAVEIGGSEYTVIGVASHSRSLGAANALTAWIPLGADPALTPDLLTASVRHAGASDGFSTLWKSEAESTFGEGTFLSLPREKNRATLLPRLLVFFFAVLLLKQWIRLLRGWGEASLADARQRLKKEYALRLTGYFVLRVLAALLLFAATLATLYGLAVFITQPLLVFPEWVPEKPVAMSSILNRFWSLIADNAAYLRLVTEQVAALQFWHFLVRLGNFLLLLGLLKTLLSSVKKKNE